MENIYYLKNVWEKNQTMNFKIKENSQMLIIYILNYVERIRLNNFEKQFGLYLLD